MIQDGMSYSPLPNNAHIKFYTGENKRNSITVYIRENNIIDINSNSNDTLVIMPRASNSFYVHFAKI
jgi:hypothetical protein